LLGLFVQLLAVPGVGLLRLLGADEAVAVGVDLLEVLHAAQPLAARHVAVAVAVHLAEPHRPAPRVARLLRLVAPRLHREPPAAGTAGRGRRPAPGAPPARTAAGFPEG